MSDGNVGRMMLGFDVGSVASKVVVTDLSGNLVEHSYTRTHGRPIETTLAVLRDILDRHGDDAFDLVAGTGSVGRLVCELLGVSFVNEVICQATAVRALHPEVRTLIEMGGQDSKLILLPDPGSNGRPMVDFTMNTNCAAGTGSFLDQQASRLGLDIEGEFGRLAVQCKSPPRVAGRCSVFAKSDMIHLQQRGATVSDIVAGLCLGLVRNLKSNLGRAMELPHPIAFCGGVASNEGVVQALHRVFELGPGELVVPEYHAVTGAIGAVLVGLKERARAGQDHGRVPGNRLDLTPLENYLHKQRGVGHRLDPLAIPSDGNPDGRVYGREVLQAERNGQPIDAYLGLDVGSISTKVAVIDDDNRVLAKIYLMTAGRPLDAVRRALKEIGSQVGGLVRIRGAATTGSGRYLTGDFIGADMVINEITAQATAAAVIDPEVDTIFEIGGQDSKYISLDQGVVVDFEMNHACAAGTGSFLE
ncbi:MAG TPA: acyl-CoA dehydratase activase, partial [Thermoguttaceae bacterium]|nr:acyl-CoA dehydratase activase [Thermoguttaceae bacterium]